MAPHRGLREAGQTRARYLSKGRQVYVEGRLTTREYEAKDGTGKRYRDRNRGPASPVSGRRGDAPGESADSEIPF